MIESDIQDDIAEEVYRQIELRGVQEHRDGTGAVYNRWSADNARVEADRAAKDGTLTWCHILRQEAFEVLAEPSGPRLERELVQLAAVCVSWLRDIRTRAATAA